VPLVFFLFPRPYDSFFLFFLLREIISRGGGLSFTLCFPSFPFLSPCTSILLQGVVEEMPAPSPSSLRPFFFLSIASPGGRGGR